MSNPSDDIYAFVGLFPIDYSTDRIALRKMLRGLDRHPRGSPLSAVGQIHRARLAIIDQAFFEGTPAEVDQFASSYLMFVCNFDGNDSDELATALVTHAPGLVEQIWGAYCLGCPDLNDLTTRDMEFVEYFRKCKLDVNFFFVAQLATDASGRDASVREILRALELKRRFADFVAANQLTPPDALKSEFQDFWKDYQSTPAPLPGSI